MLKIYKNLIANPHINFYLNTQYNTSGEKGIIRRDNPEDKEWTDVSPIVDHEKYLNVYIVNYSHSYTANDHVWDDPENDCIYLY